MVIPPIFHFGVLGLAALMQAGVLSANLADLLNLLSAISPFAFNLYFLIWALRTMQKAPLRAPIASLAS